MKISIFTFLTSFLIASILISLMILYIKRNSKIITSWSGVLLIILFLPLIRLLVAIELPYTHVIESNVIYPVIYNALTSRVVVVFDFDVTIETLLMTIWLLGAAYCFIEIVVRYRKTISSFRHIQARCNTIETRIVHRILSEKGYKRRRIKVIQASSITEPMIYGIRPTVVLPDQQLDDTELKNIITHELGHYFHGDLIFKWFLEGICALYWWFPPIRILKKYIYSIMEIRADSFVVDGRNKLERVAYMETLLKICKQKQRNTQSNPFVMPLFSYGDGITMKQRFQAISHSKVKDTAKYRLFVLAIIASGLFLMSYTFVLQPNYEVPSTYQESYSVDADSFYWMSNENGGYDLYSIDGEHMGWVPKIQDELVEIPIHNNIN